MSQTSPAIAARSPEPAKRWAIPHSFNACAAGMRAASMVSITSIAADSRAAGVMGLFHFCSGESRLDQQQHLECEIEPHHEQHKHAGEPGHRAASEIVRGHEYAGMNEARNDEHP